MDIQSEIVEFNNEITDIEDTLKRLMKADSGDTYNSYKTTSKLANLVGDHSINISDGHLNKAHDLLRKYSGSQSNYPRNSSEPPISDTKDSTVDPEAKRLSESQSLHCLSQSQQQRYVLHEDHTNTRHWIDATNEDLDNSSVSSMATCETTLDSERKGSLTSVNTADNVDVIADCKYVVDLQKYAEQEWKGETKTAQTIRAVSVIGHRHFIL